MRRTTCIQVRFEVAGTADAMDFHHKQCSKVNEIIFSKAATGQNYAVIEYTTLRLLVVVL